MRRVGNKVDVVAAVDAGGRANIGWAIRCSRETRYGSGHKSLDTLASLIAGFLDSSHTVSLGIEAPLFLPIPTEYSSINSSRIGEGNRAWSASAGAAVTPLGVHQLAFVLAKIKAECAMPPRVSFDLQDRAPCLKLWEAFVSGKAKSDSHIGDAIVAIDTYQSDRTNSVWIEGPVLNLAGAAVLAVGLSDDPSLTRQSMTVIKPNEL